MIDGELILMFDEIVVQYFVLLLWVVCMFVFECVDLFFFEGMYVNFKFELLQVSGSFKVCGVFMYLFVFDEVCKNVGVICVLVGNYVVVVVYVVMWFGSSVKVVMFYIVSLMCIVQCKQYCVEVVLVGSVLQVFDFVWCIEVEEGCFFIYLFNGYYMIFGIVMFGYEWVMQMFDFDVVIVLIGGGGFVVGMVIVLWFVNLYVYVYGVELDGVDVMSCSFVVNYMIKMSVMQMIVDLLMVLYIEEYSYQLCWCYFDCIVIVFDDVLCVVMLFLFLYLKLLVELVCVVVFVVLFGLLCEMLQGKCVGVLLLGMNIDFVIFGMYFVYV